MAIETFLAAVAATATAPHITSGNILGSLGTGGAALASTAALGLGVKGRGHVKLTHESAGLLGLVTGTLYVSAGDLWTNASALTNSLTDTLTGPDGAFGNVEEGGVALLLTLWFWLGKPRPGKAALMGIAAGTIYSLAGGVWAIPQDLIMGIFAHLGVK